MFRLSSMETSHSTTGYLVDKDSYYSNVLHMKKNGFKIGSIKDKKAKKKKKTFGTFIFKTERGKNVSCTNLNHRPFFAHK